MAVAQATSANASNCLKPWIIPDVWLELPENRRSIESDHFDRYVDCAGAGECRMLNPVVAERDLYEAPVGDSTGTGFNLVQDVGRCVTLKAGDPNVMEASVYYRLNLPRADGLEATTTTNNTARIFSAARGST